MRYSICWIAASVELLLLGGAGRGGKASVRRARADSRLRAGFTGRLHGATSRGDFTRMAYCPDTALFPMADAGPERSTPERRTQGYAA